MSKLYELALKATQDDKTVIKETWYGYISLDENLK